MLSIIIPVYNVCSYIDRCLSSIVNQSVKEFEILLINDGSTDDSPKKCAEWAARDHRISYISQTNRGLGETRNLGVAKASYDYITYLDADDWWECDYIKEMMAAITACDADVAVCDIWYVTTNNDEENKMYSEIRLPSGIAINPLDRKDTICKFRTFAWGKIFKKDLLTRNHIYQPTHTFEDIAVTPLTIALAHKVCRVGRPLYYYLKNRPGSLANISKNYVDTLISLKELENNFKAFDLFQAYYTELRRLAYSQVRFIARKKKEKDELIDDMLIYMQTIYPEGAAIANMRFGVVGENEVDRNCVTKVIDNITIFPIQIAYCGKIQDISEDLIDEIDCIVYAGNLNLHAIKKRISTITSYSIPIIYENKKADFQWNETDYWNESDKIFDFLCERCVQV